MTRRASSQQGLAALTFGLVAVASYTLQRLIAAAGGEVDFGAIVNQVHVPYYWRCAVAVLHGGLAATLVGMGLDADRATRWLGRGPWLVALVVVPSAIAMVVVP